MTAPTIAQPAFQVSIPGVAGGESVRFQMVLPLDASFDELVGTRATVDARKLVIREPLFTQFEILGVWIGGVKLATIFSPNPAKDHRFADLVRVGAAGYPQLKVKTGEQSGRPLVLASKRLEGLEIGVRNKTNATAAFEAIVFVG